MTPLAVGLALAGAVFGVVADRFAVRWPEHDQEIPAGRAVGWRTVATAGIGAFAFWLLGDRFDSADVVVQVLFGLWFAALVVGFAIDLDQRLLPDELTLPIIPLALLLDVTGRNPLVGGELLAAVLIAVIVPFGLYLASVPFGAGA
ncbi:MAG: prepilin peptidase, partial [Chloroflexota bacterium]|nr:prepilin peptidase [Chloroflexota bacterium]